MGVFHQMGHDSENLVREVAGYAGVILSPVNATMDRARALIAEHAESGMEFLFDPQMYFPRSEREKLHDWPYFPRDVESADLSDLAWWSDLNDRLADACRALGVSAVCSPTIVPASFSPDFLRQSVEIGTNLHRSATDLDVVQTVVVDLSVLAQLRTVMEIASIASSASTRRLYLVFLVNQEPRREIAESRWLTGALRLIAELRGAGMSTTVGCCDQRRSSTPQQVQPPVRRVSSSTCAGSLPAASMSHLAAADSSHTGSRSRCWRTCARPISCAFASEGCYRTRANVTLMGARYWRCSTRSLDRHGSACRGATTCTGSPTWTLA